MHSSRRFYYVLVVLVVFLIWNVRRLSRDYDGLHGDGALVDVVRSPPERLRSDSEPTPPAEAVHQDHAQPQSDQPSLAESPAEIETWQAAAAAEEEEDGSKGKVERAKKKPASGGRKGEGAVWEDSDASHVDTIEKPDGSMDEVADIGAKLHHPDDDETDSSDGDQRSFAGVQDKPAAEKSRGRKQGAGVEAEAPSFGTMRTQDAPSGAYAFPSWDECESVKDKADTLPNMILFPFEDVVAEVTLEGWEDEWISNAKYTGPKLAEPKIDFVYNWVNGSQPEFVESMHQYELNSTLNDPDGEWIGRHSTNRYREWDELRYSVRSIEKYAGNFTNRIQFLVNAFQLRNDTHTVAYGKQKPHWLREDDKVQVLSQEDFFGSDERKCLPTFNSLTIENQIYNTKSETDRLFALSDDMILGKVHAASDIYSPLFGPTMGFKDNSYNTLKPPSEEDAIRFGEKPFLIYTSWLLNRRFGARKRKGQVHFGHSLSRSIMREAITSFPRPALRSAFQRFRGETGFQLYSWFLAFHYTMERHREALLWSYIMLRSDTDGDGYLDWSERKTILSELSEGMQNEMPEMFRKRVYYRVADYLRDAGLEAPKVNTDVLWTSLDGPAMIQNLDCDSFDTEDCLAPGFATPSSDDGARSPVFSSAAIFDKVSRESAKCGDCLIKLILNRQAAGLGSLLPHRKKQAKQREIVVKALTRYMYTIVKPDADFFMVTDAEQAEHALLKPYVQHKKSSGQICLNDDVVTTNEQELEKLRLVMKALFDGLLPHPSSLEI